MFDYISYWKKRDWTGDYPKWADKIKPHLKGKSVLDLGCGQGRFVPIFKGMDYLGIDISKDMIKRAKKKYKNKIFSVVDINDIHSNIFLVNTIFTCTLLQHIIPEKIERLSERMKVWGDRIIMIESVKSEKELAPYCFIHDYDKLFNIVHKEKLDKDLVLMIHE